VSWICAPISRGRVAQIDPGVHTHEVTEARLTAEGLGYEEAHAAAQATHPLYANYDPEVIAQYPEYFNDAWREYWGLK
jgi:hypothetical protein